MGLIEKICRYFPDATPDQVRAMLARLHPSQIKLHRLTRSED